MSGAVDDQRGIHRLAGLRGAGAARQHAHAVLARERERKLRLLDRARRDHAERHDLVVRGVGGVAPARERIEAHLAPELRPEPAFKAPGTTVLAIDRTLLTSWNHGPDLSAVMRGRASVEPTHIEYDHFEGHQPARFVATISCAGSFI
jgi:hypothetical protein